MTRKHHGASILCLLLASLAAAPALAAEDGAEASTGRVVERRGDLVSIFSGEVHVPAGIRQRGSVVCVGGSAVVEGDVTQDVIAILCDATVRGEVGGTVTGVRSDMSLRDATISRELVNVLGTLEMDNTTVHRELVNILGSLDRDELSRAIGQVVNIGFGGDWFPSVWALIFWVRLFHKFVAFVLILLIVLLVPDRVRAMADEAPLRYVPAFFMGLLGYLAMLVIVGLLTVTFVGIFPAMLAFYIVKWMGIAAIFYAVGRRLARGAGFSPSVLGAVLLIFGLYVLAMMLPSALGFAGLLLAGGMKLIFLLLVEVPAVGLAMLTRLGNRPAAPGPLVEPIRAEPPVAPVSPAVPSAD